MDQGADSKVVDFLNKVNQVYKCSKTILFGSRARGDSFSHSDYDIIIVSPDFENMHFHDRIAEMFKYWDEKEDLEVLCYTPEEFDRKRKQIGIVSQAVREGVEIKL